MPFFPLDKTIMFCTRLISHRKQSKKPVSGAEQEQNESMVLLRYTHLNTFNLNGDEVCLSTFTLQEI